MITNLEELIAALNKEPEDSEIKKNEDGSLYIPISIVQSKLDEFFGFWEWEFKREAYFKNEATGTGMLTVIYPNGYIVNKSGSAGIEFSSSKKLDYPRLDSMCLLNAAKKLGKAFGRDLNRDKDDQPIPVKQLKETLTDDQDEFEQKNKVKKAIAKAEFLEDAEKIIREAGMEYMFKNDKEVKAILGSKKQKPQMSY